MAFNTPEQQAAMDELQGFSSGRPDVLRRIEQNVGPLADPRRPAAGAGGGLGSVPMIGGKRNLADMGRFDTDWYDLPLWQREEIMRQTQQQNAQVEAEEKKRRQQEDAEALAGMGPTKPRQDPYKDLTGSVPPPDYLMQPNAPTAPQEFPGITKPFDFNYTPGGGGS